MSDKLLDLTLYHWETKILQNLQDFIHLGDPAFVRLHIRGMEILDFQHLQANSGANGDPMSKYIL